MEIGYQVFVRDGIEGTRREGGGAGGLLVLSFPIVGFSRFVFVYNLRVCRRRYGC